MHAGTYVHADCMHAFSPMSKSSLALRRVLRLVLRLALRLVLRLALVPALVNWSSSSCFVN